MLYTIYPQKRQSHEALRMAALNWLRHHKRKVDHVIYCGGSEQYQWIVIHTAADYSGAHMKVQGSSAELAHFILLYLRGTPIEFDAIPHLSRAMRGLICDSTKLVSSADIESGMDISFELTYVPDGGVLPHPYTGDVMQTDDEYVWVGLDGRPDPQRRTRFARVTMYNVHMFTRKVLEP